MPLGVAEVDGADHDDAVRLGELGHALVHGVVEHAPAGLLAAVAGDAAADGLVAHLHLLARDARRRELFGGDGERGVDAAVLDRVAVDHEYLHLCHLSLVVVPCHRWLPVLPTLPMVMMVQ